MSIAALKCEVIFLYIFIRNLLCPFHKANLCSTLEFNARMEIRWCKGVLLRSQNVQFVLYFNARLGSTGAPSYTYSVGTVVHFKIGTQLTPWALFSVRRLLCLTVGLLSWLVSGPNIFPSTGFCLLDAGSTDWFCGGVLDWSPDARISHSSTRLNSLCFWRNEHGTQSRPNSYIVVR